MNKTRNTSVLEEGIESHTQECIVITTYFWLEKGKHVGICNVQCLNAAGYKKFSKKNGKIFSK